MNTTSTLTTAEAAVLGGALGTLGAIAIAWCVLVLIGGWKMLKKTGEPGWKILIPFYNIYILFKIAGMKNWFWIYLVVTLACSIFMVAQGYDPSYNEVQLEAFLKEHAAVVVVSVLAGIFELVVYIKYCINTSRAFGHGAGYAIGLFFLSGIFMMVLGFGNSKYDKKILKK